MPLFKRTPFALLEPPKDLDPHEHVFQVRFTKEIFRNYQEYLKRLNLYRQRVWTCKVTGKTNLTYEEALVSEHRAAEKAQQFPKELMAPVLRMIQYSTLNLYDLVDKIYLKLHEDVYEGLKAHAKKDGSVAACKILRLLENGSTRRYEVEWLSRDKRVKDTSVVEAEDLVLKKSPLSRHVLKVFVRESTSQNAPWVIHENLAKKYGISTDLPRELKDRLTYENGCLRFIKETKRAGKDDMMDVQNNTKKRRHDGTAEGGENVEKKLKPDEDFPRVRYPIDDLFVQPSADDPIFSKRPPLSTDFRVPMNCVGELLMVWDFCSSFGRLLKLLPFSLADFENAICHKESNVVLIVEVHAALFHLLIMDGGEYFTCVKNKKRKFKVTLVSWAEYLCDFLEMGNRTEFSSNIGTIRRGHYGLIDVNVKLGILSVLVEEALTTAAVRNTVNDRIDQQQVLKATKKDDVRKKEQQDVENEGINKLQMDQTDVAENGNESINGQNREKEGKDKNVVEKKTEERETHQTQHLERQIEKLSIRTNSLGKDRYHNRYLFFYREGRLFVESADSKQWGYYSTKEELDALLGSLNRKGIRERALKKQLEKFYQKISMALEKRRKDATQKLLLEEAILRRSTRVRAQPRDNPNMAFLKYVNKWKET